MIIEHDYHRVPEVRAFSICQCECDTVQTDTACLGEVPLRRRRNAGTEDVERDWAIGDSPSESAGTFHSYLLSMRPHHQRTSHICRDSVYTDECTR